MSSDDRPFITLPADQPDYETLSGLTLEQKAVLPARFHTPDWLDTTPGVFVCRVCWDDGEVTGWPCASALAGRDQVFADPVDAPAREVPSGDQPKPREWRDSEGDLYRDVNADQVVLIECKGRPPETAVGPHSRAVVERSWGPLVEVLADQPCTSLFLYGDSWFRCQLAIGHEGLHKHEQDPLSVSWDDNAAASREVPADSEASS